MSKSARRDQSERSVDVCPRNVSLPGDQMARNEFAATGRSNRLRLIALWLSIADEWTHDVEC
jgi:hypothetical protein